MYTLSSTRKGISLVTLVTFIFSLFSPFANTALAANPDVGLSYSADPTGTGTLTITATYTDTIVTTPLISIDQPGSTDIVDATMTDLGTGTVFTYDYTVFEDDGVNYIDGTAMVSLTGAYNSGAEIANAPTNTTFAIDTLDTTPPVVTLSGSDTSVEYGTDYTELGASWTDNVDGSGDTFV